MTEGLTALSIPLGALLAIIVQVVKIYPVPPRFVQLVVLVSSFILAFMCKYNSGWYEIMINWILTSSAAISSYELVLKDHNAPKGN